MQRVPNPRDRSPYPRNRPKPVRQVRVDWVYDELARLRRLALRRRREVRR
jgi:hypothetical protein